MDLGRQGARAEDFTFLASLPSGTAQGMARTKMVRHRPRLGPTLSIASAATALPLPSPPLRSRSPLNQLGGLGAL